MPTKEMMKYSKTKMQFIDELNSVVRKYYHSIDPVDITGGLNIVAFDFMVQQKNNVENFESEVENLERGVI